MTMIKPIFEIVDEREFTDREEELDFMWRQVERARERRGSSYAIIARKGWARPRCWRGSTTNCLSNKTR